jgi:glucose-1-phosphate adenylyltransferase
MGIYLFNTDKLIEMLNTPVPDLLHNETRLPHDFGGNVFPNHVATRHIHAHLFDGFWEDLGTIKSYHEVSLALAEPDPPFDFFTAEGLIFTRMRNLPASRINGAQLDRCTIADGCVIGSGTRIVHCLIGVRSKVGGDCHLKDVVMIGSDRFETEADMRENRAQNRPDFNIGDGSAIEGAILDKDCRVGKGVRIRPAIGKPDYDDPTGRYCIRDGIVCVPRGAIIPDGMVI